MRQQKRFWKKPSTEKGKESRKWDFKSTFRLVLVAIPIGLILFMFYKPTSDTRDKNRDYYNSEAKGIVYSIEQKTGMSQGRYGMKETTLGYEIRYSYKVNGREYYNAEIVGNTSVDNVKFIGFVNRNLNQENFTIKYVSWKPEDCFVVKDIE